MGRRPRLLQTNRDGQQYAIRAPPFPAGLRQTERFGNRRMTNARMSHRQVKKHCALDEPGEMLLKQAMHEMGLSAPAHDKILCVARTIADLDSTPDVTATHLSEAIQYRRLDRNLFA
jgi:magnesium chelatase family protein